MGLPPDGLEVGSSADLLAIRGTSLEEVVADASDDRVVIRKGRVVARSRVEVETAPGISTQ